MGSARGAHRRGHRRRPAAREGPRRRSSPRFRTRALTDEAPVYRPADGASRRTSTRRAAARPRRRSAPPATPRDALLTLLGVADDREQALGLPPVRPHGADQHARAAGHGRRRRARQGHRPRRWRCRSTATAATATSIRIAARMLAVAEAARNVACAGGAAARRDQLPELRQSRAAGDHVAVRAGRRGHRRACRALDMPITGGNVSLYNETDGKAIYPTPVIGVVGLLERRRSRRRRARFKRPATSIVLLGEGRGELGGSEYLKTRARPGARRAAGARSRSASGRCRRCSSTWRPSG